MFSCSYCSLEFNTETELNVHIEKCRENVQSPPEPSSSKSIVCMYCKLSFVTNEEFTDHTCNSNLGIALGAIKLLTQTIKVMNDILPKPLGQCRYCTKVLYNVDEVVEHRKTCQVVQCGKLIEQLYRHYKEMVGEPVDEPVTTTPEQLYRHYKKMVGEPVDEPVTTTPMFPSSPSKSEESEQSKSSKKRVFDTGTERDDATKSESSLETFSPPSKIYRTNDKDKRDIEIRQENATDSKICDANTKTCAEKTFDCVFCVLKFQSLDALRTHIIQSCEKTKK